MKEMQKKGGRHLSIDETSLVLSGDSPFVVTEAYKALRTNIVFSLPGTDCKCIAITSTGRAEGKSTNSINTALSFGQLGKKVILIDADMRLPTVAAKLGIKGQPGLSNLLIGDIKLDETDFRVEKYGIDIMPAGTIPPDPTKLLDSAEMEQLIAALRLRYDYIIIDLPPANTVTDAVILSKCVDGYLLLIKHGVVEHRAVAEMVSRFQMVNAKILGFLYVDAEIERKEYGKKYGYGYGK